MIPRRLRSKDLARLREAAVDRRRALDSSPIMRSMRRRLLWGVNTAFHRRNSSPIRTRSSLRRPIRTVPRRRMEQRREMLRQALPRLP